MTSDIQIPVLPISDPSMFPRAEEQVLGARNLLPMTVSMLKKGNASGTWNGNTYTLNGITFTVNTDSKGGITSITVNGTSSALTDLNISPDGSTRKTLDNFGLEVGTRYILSGTSASQVENSKLMLNGSAYNVEDTTGGGVAFTVDSTNAFVPQIRIPSGKTVSNYTFKPMFRLATDPDPSYSQYAMTNKQLTDALTKITFTAPTITGGTVNAGGYCKIGKIVIVNMRVTFSSGSPTMSGFPSYTGDTKVVLHGRKTSDASYVNGSIYANGNGDIVGTSLSGATVILNGVYICS